MRINRIVIEKLYNQFSYDLSFSSIDTSLSILTGPNGYGKTTVLQIIDSISKGDFIYFYTFPFEKIELEFTDDIFLHVNVDKTQNDDEFDDEDSIKQITFIYKDEKQNVTSSFVLKLESVYKLLPSPYRRNMDVGVSREQLVSYLIKFIEEHPDFNVYETIAQEQKQEQFLFLVGNFKSFFIPAQRLYYIEKEKDRDYYDRYRVEKKSSIDEVLYKIKRLLQEYRFSYLQNAQNHDNQFISKYLSSDIVGYTEKEYKSESENLQALIDELYSYKLIDKIKLFDYEAKHKKILSVYLNDLKEKLDLYNNILSKLRIFSSILKEKMFTNKKISFSPENGLSIYLNDGAGININSLSSGEKNEIIMLYHLIFDVKENSVLLIDEPEISLHVAWQLEFLNDIEKIIENKKIQVIIATHSPQIINEHWDLCFDFYGYNEK